MLLSYVHHKKFQKEELAVKQETHWSHIKVAESMYLGHHLGALPTLPCAGPGPRA